MLNDLFQTYKKIIVLAVLLMSAILFWFFGCHRLGRNDIERTSWKQTKEDVQSYDFYTEHISGSIVFGTGGHLSSDKTQPVVMKVSGKEDAFTGTIKITLPGDEGRGVAYQSAVKCKKGTFSRVVLNIPKLGNVPFFSMEILDQFGTEELAEMIIGAGGDSSDSQSPEIMEKKTVFLGVLSDEPEKLRWMNDLEIISGQNSFVLSLYEIKEGDLLGGADYLDSLAGILIDAYDTSSLSIKQKNCLMDWVENKGGNLLVGTGAHAGNVLAGLTDYTGLSPGEEKEESLQFYHDEETASHVLVTTNSLQMITDHGWKTDSLSYPASCSHCLFGRGSLTVLTWSLVDDSLQQWTGRDKMTQELVKQFIPGAIYSDTTDEDSIWQIKKTLYSFLNSQTPNTFYYALFFILYLSALALFSYYILRRMKKREYIWFFVPVISLFFTICLAIRSGGFGGNGMSSYSGLEIIDFDDSQQDVFFLYQNNEGENNRIDLIPDVSSVEPLDYSYRSGDEDVASLRRLGQDYTINNTRNGYDIDFKESVPGTSQMLKMVKSSQETDSIQYFTADLQAGYTTFSGTVTNHCPWKLSRMILIRGNQYTVLTDVQAGETKPVNKDDILCWSGYEQENISYGMEDEHSASLSLTDYICCKYINGREDYNTVIIAGITDERDISLFSDQKKLENQQTVFINRSQLPSQDGMHYISDINKECLLGDNADSVLSSDILAEKKVKAVYQFDRDKTVWMAARNNDSFEGTIYAYNQMTGKEHEIFTHKGDILDYRELAPYISETGRLNLTYNLKGDQDYGPAPVLTFMLKDVNESQ